MLKRAGSQRPLVNMRVGGGDEALEQGMGLVRFAAEFRMKLRSDEKGMVRQFNYLDQVSVRRGAAENEVPLLEFVAIGVVEFVTVPMPLVHHKGAVKFGG